MSAKSPLGASREPQSYEGLNIVVPLSGWQLVKSKRSPTTNDKKYPVGSMWVNTVAKSIYFLNGTSGNWSAGAALNLNNSTTTAVSMSVGNTYVANASTMVTFTLPSTANQGDIIQVIGNGAGGWLVAQNANQVIKINAQTTTTGTGGSVSSTNRYDSIDLVCVVGGTSTTWVINNFTGSLTFV